MRYNLVVMGTTIVMVGYLLEYGGVLSFVYTVPIGLLNIFLGAITPRNQGVVISSDRSSPVKILVDKAVVGSNTYELVFLEGKLILKKLSSATLTVVLPLLLTLGGFLIIGNLIDGIILGLTGLSLQEYTTQRRRDKMSRQDQLSATGKGDLEFPYAKLEKIEISRSRLYLHLADRILRINISRRYSRLMRPVLGKIVSAKYQVDN